MKRFAVALPFLLGFSGLAQARPTTYNLAPANGEKQITFESKTPVEYIQGDVDQLGGSIGIDVDKPGLGLHASISVPVASMRTGMDQRDEHMRSEEWLDAEHHPAILFDLDPVNPKRISSRGKDTWAGTVEGTFVLKGVTKKISVPVTVTKDGADRLIVEGRFPVRLSDYGIHGPLAMRVIGLKVNETVQVGFRLVGVKDVGWDNVKPSARPSAKPAKAKRRLH